MVQLLDMASHRLLVPTYSSLPCEEMGVSVVQGYTPVIIRVIACILAPKLSNDPMHLPIALFPLAILQSTSPDWSKEDYDRE